MPSKARRGEGYSDRSRLLSVVAVGLLLATGAGAATAARMIGGKDIKRDAIARKHIRGQAVSGGRIAERAIKQRHLAPGLPGATELHYPFAVAELADGEGSDGREGVQCPDGTFPTGGSAAAFDPDSDEMVADVVTGSQAGFIDTEGVPHGWSGEWHNDTGETVSVVVEVICAPAGVTSAPPLGDPTEPPEADRGGGRGGSVASE